MAGGSMPAVKASSLKAVSSETKTTGASGSYFVSMAGGSLPVATNTAAPVSAAPALTTPAPAPGAATVVANVAKPQSSAAEAPAGTGAGAGTYYLAGFGSASSSMKASSLKAVSSETKSTGVSGSYFDSMAGGNLPVASAAAAPVSVPAFSAPALAPAAAVAATGAKPGRSASESPAGASTIAGSSYLGGLGSAGFSVKTSSLKAVSSETKTTGASGSYFDTMAGGGMPVAAAAAAPVSAPAFTSPASAPVAVAVAPVVKPESSASEAPAGAGAAGSYLTGFGSAGSSVKASGLKRLSSDTKTIGASGSYFNMMAGGSMSVAAPAPAPATATASPVPKPKPSTSEAPAGASAAGSYLAGVGSTGSSVKASSLKAVASETKTTGASGSYFDSIGGSVFSTAPSTDDSIRLAPLAVSAVSANAAAKTSNGKEAPAPPREVVYEEISFVWDTRALKRGLAALVAAGLGYQFLRTAFDVVAEQFAQGPPF
uniref:Uncharacterized protein n=1 Tax=Heterosigma akashiwo TaxID=2829 RepID=A0A7S3XXR6_HETAK